MRRVFAAAPSPETEGGAMLVGGVVQGPDGPVEYQLHRRPSAGRAAERYVVSVSDAEGSAGTFCRAVELVTRVVGCSPAGAVQLAGEGPLPALLVRLEDLATVLAVLDLEGLTEALTDHAELHAGEVDAAVRNVMAVYHLSYACEALLDVPRGLSVRCCSLCKLDRRVQVRVDPTGHVTAHLLPRLQHQSG
jgi:hypothetical protein